MSRESSKKVALVLSGGGANGAYEVGILKALANGQCATTGYRPIDPDIFIGTSIGAFNAAFLASQWDEYGSAAVANLESFWLQRVAGPWQANGVFRLRCNPLSLLRPQNWAANPMTFFQSWLQDAGVLSWDGIQRGVHFATTSEESIEQRTIELFNLSSFISTEPMETMLQELEYDAIRRSKRVLKIAATNWATGELRLFENHDMTDSFGPLAVRASASIPGFFPPVEFGSQPFCDGSVLLNTPLSPAIRSGADFLHVIYLDPEIKNVPISHVRNSYETFMRMMQIRWAAAYNDDIEDAGRINRGLEALLSIFEGDEPDSRDIRSWLKMGGSPRLQQRFRPLTVFRYHPHDPLEGDLAFLNFDRDRVEALIERGFQDAINHDSKLSRDIIPAAHRNLHGPSTSAGDPVASARPASPRSATRGSEPQSAEPVSSETRQQDPSELNLEKETGHAQSHQVLP